MQNSLQRIDPISLLPSYIQLLPAHVSIGGQLTINWLTQVEITDNGGRPQVKHLFYSSRQSVIRHCAGTECIHHYRQGLSHTDGIGQLDLASAGKTGSYHILSHPASGIGSGAIHFCGVFTRKGPAAMGCSAAITVHHDLPPSQPAIPLRTANNEPAGRVYIDLGILIHQCRRDGRLDNQLDNILANLCQRGFSGMLGRNY